ncbi:hypothetical protein BDA96_03G023300 [Sorghum bicolor]|uniref:Uncharacterized protein n=1 Tax=Sorghum bicolor TaxID=4558 RepID=A0A921RBL2_SORBI|nr:hypothetical protein BDA96_03G023300 [Sorghum bicolor]
MKIQENMLGYYGQRDYVCIAAPAHGGGADHRPLCSVLVGCTSFGGPFRHNLRLHRFRVAQSGRVIGQSDDLLEPLFGVSPSDVPSIGHADDGQTEFDDAMAALGPDGKHLYIICVHRPVLSSDVASCGGGRATEIVVFPPKVFRVDTGDMSLSPMRPLPFTRASYEAISAHGALWVPVVLLTKAVENCPSEWRLFIYRLVEVDDDDGSWVEVTSADFQYELSRGFRYGGTLIQGYAVISDRFILLSFIDSTFFCFDCANGTLAPVTTEESSSSTLLLHQYVPISGKGVHFEGAIYFIRGTKLFAYRYSPLDPRPLAPPLEIDTIWPYDEEGYGFVVHLAGHILCAVWINMKRRCGCTTRHVLITTFNIGGHTHGTGCFIPSDVEVLHSTCRRIGMLRTEEPRPECYDFFCFLQEYPDTEPRFDPSVPSELGVFDGNHRVPDMLPTCRKFLSKKHGTLSLEECNVAIRSDFYFICQVDQRSLVYQVSISGGKLACNEKVLDALVCLDTVRPGDVGIDDPPEWFFVHHGSMLDVIPSLPYYNHYVVDVERKCYNIHKNKRSKLFFSAVFRVGQYTVALCDTLQDVYVLNQNNFQWRRQKTSSRSLDLSHKVKISGFVDLGDDAFMISDAETNNCFLFDLKRGEWFAVEPPRGYIFWQYAAGLLNGRSIFAEGFIYTCSAGGLIAFELIDKNDSYCLGQPIMLNSSWKYIFGERRFLSFDSVCKGEIDSSIVFCVVQGCPMAVPFTSRHHFAATTVHVKLQKTLRETKEPVSIDRVGVVCSSIDQNGRILTNYAFAL